jgi:transcription elongation factor Elf1
MTTTRMPECKCPVCNTKLDAATSIDEAARPSRGDITLCIDCHSVLEFDVNLRLQTIDIKTLPQDMQDQLVHLVMAMSDSRPTLH